MYMPLSARKASDLIITKKLAQHAGTNVYFNRQYLPELLRKDRQYSTVFEQLQKVDRDGLFLPVLLNEIDKYANKIYPADCSPAILDVVIHFMNFIYKIATKVSEENVPLTFQEDEISVKIVLAISDATSDVNIPIRDIEYAIQNKRVNTIYVLATGSKIDSAKEIAQKVYERNIQDIFEPIETTYKRYTRKPSGADSICFEINLLNT